MHRMSPIPREAIRRNNSEGTAKVAKDFGKRNCTRFIGESGKPDNPRFLPLSFLFFASFAVNPSLHRPGDAFHSSRELCSGVRICMKHRGRGGFFGSVRMAVAGGALRRSFRMSQQRCGHACPTQWWQSRGR